MQTTRRITWNLVIGLALVLFALAGYVPVLADCDLAGHGADAPRSCCVSHHLTCTCHHTPLSQQGTLSGNRQMADCPCNLMPVRDGVPLPSAVRVFLPAPPVAHAIFPMGPPQPVLLPVGTSLALPQSDYPAPASPRAPPFQG